MAESLADMNYVHVYRVALGFFFWGWGEQSIFTIFSKFSRKEITENCCDGLSTCSYDLITIVILKLMDIIHVYATASNIMGYPFTPSTDGVLHHKRDLTTLLLHMSPQRMYTVHMKSESIHNHLLRIHLYEQLIYRCKYKYTCMYMILYINIKSCEFGIKIKTYSYLQ